MKILLLVVAAIVTITAIVIAGQPSTPPATDLPPRKTAVPASAKDAPAKIAVPLPETRGWIALAQDRAFASLWTKCVIDHRTNGAVSQTDQARICGDMMVDAARKGYEVGAYRLLREWRNTAFIARDGYNCRRAQALMLGTAQTAVDARTSRSHYLADQLEYHKKDNPCPN